MDHPPNLAEEAAKSVMESSDKKTQRKKKINAELHQDPSGLMELNNE